MCTLKTFKDTGQMEHIICFILGLMLTLKAILVSRPVIKTPLIHDRYVIFSSIISLASNTLDKAIWACLNRFLQVALNNPLCCCSQSTLPDGQLPFGAWYNYKQGSVSHNVFTVVTLLVYILASTFPMPVCIPLLSPGMQDCFK